MSSKSWPQNVGCRSLSSDLNCVYYELKFIIFVNDDILLTTGSYVFLLFDIEIIISRNCPKYTVCIFKGNPS